MLRIAHRRDVWGDGELWDGLVDVSSGCKGYAHTELLFSNGESFSSLLKFDKAHTVYPLAYYYRPKGGPQLRRIEFKENFWDYTNLPFVSAQEEDDLYNYCKSVIDDSIKAQAGYDKSGVLRFVLPFMHEHPEDWFCTEVVEHVCQKSLELFGNRKAWKDSPNSFKKLCDKLFPNSAVR